MKRWIILAGIILSGIAAVVVSERRKVDVPASPAALLYLIADTEQELMRMPVSFTRMSDDEEIRIGNELAKVYAQGEQREATPEAAIVERYLARVGQEVARGAHRRLPYKFHYLPQPYFMNAFALPGGHVYVGSGLLELMDSEDELAAVLGHEIEHIDHYHCAERAQRERALRKIPLGALVDLPIEVFQAGYSKDQELEADREGTRIAVQAGYSANGAIRMFENFQRLYQHYQTSAKTPQEELSQVAQQTLEGYFRSHPLPSERISQVQTLIASEGWTARPERDLAVAYIFWTAKAQTHLHARDYVKAEQLANQSLRLRPDQPKALLVLARARFAQANFPGAADAYRKILEIDKTSHPEIITSYAQALAAGVPQDARMEFERWVGTINGEKPREVDLAADGLSLLAGNPAPAQRLAFDLKQSQDLNAPGWVGVLGWWYYLSGNYQEAVSLLSEALQQRPGDAVMGVRLAWGLMEMRRYSDALQTVDSIADDAGINPEKAMVRAAIRWQAQDRDRALVDFNAALAGQAEWGNSNWVKALYSPLVVQIIHELQAEREAQQKKAGVLSRGL